MNYTFKLKSPNSTSESLIYFRSYFHKERKTFIYSTGEKILPNEWDPKNHQPNNLNARGSLGNNHRTINRQLNRYGDYFYEIVNRYKNINTELTTDVLRERFNEEFKKTKNIDDFFKIYDMFLDDRKNDYSRNSITNSTLKRYITNKNLLLHFQEHSKRKLTLGGFNEKTYNQFLKFSIEVRKHSANTLNRNVGLLKTFLNWTIKNKLSFNDSFQSFKKPPRFTTDEVALTKEEVNEIYLFDFSKNKRLERVRDLFVFGCATSLRYGNYSNITKNDIQDGFIRVVDMKSKLKRLSIPLNSISKEILEKYDYNLPSLTNQKMNLYIKEVFKEAGFTDEIKKTMKYGDELVEKVSKFHDRITSHTARRTCITILINAGTPLKVVMSISGHTSLKDFITYYKPSEDDKINYMESVFN